MKEKLTTVKNNNMNQLTEKLNKMQQTLNNQQTATIGNTVLGVVSVWKLRQEHDEEIKRVMEETGCTFRKWNGKAFWELAKECGHTSLDFDKCDCKRHYA